jgi:hypothetical protein
MLPFVPTVLVTILGLSAIVGLFLPRRTEINRLLTALASRQSLAMFAVFGLSLLHDASISLWRKSVPDIHDEFSYLLAADTFASGRLSNPPPPCPTHFDSYHILVEPTYVSKYPPGQGMALALGQVLFGKPIVGAWICLACCAAATCWMLQGWMTSRWALLGGLVVALHPTIHHHPSFSWGHTFWGGGVAFLGGALVYGALPRVRRLGSPFAPVWLGVGLILLANSRPFEGFVTALPAGCVLLVWLVRELRNGNYRPLLRLMPLAIVLCLGGGWMAYYNFRTTGDPLLFPYRVHEQRFAVAPPFFLLPLKSEPPIYRHPDGSFNRHYLHRYEFHYGFEWICHQMFDGWQSWWAILWREKFRTVHYYYLSPIVLGLAGLLWIRSRRVLLALGVCLLLSTLLALTTWTFPHYVAPFTALVVYLQLQGLRLWHVRRPLGSAVTTLILLASLGWFVYLQFSWAIEKIQAPAGWAHQRQELLQSLEATPERYLILVRYAEGHRRHVEWVYNRSDLNSAPVIWARSFDEQSDQCLRQHFPDRTIFILEVKDEDWRIGSIP